MDINKNMATWEEAGNGPRPEIDIQPEQKLSLEWITSQMDAIIQNTQYITDAMEAIRDIKSENQLEAAVAQDKADAMRQIIQSREDTNRKALELLEKMYKDISRPPRPSIHELGIDPAQLIGNMHSKELLTLIRELAGM